MNGKFAILVHYPVSNDSWARKQSVTFARAGINSGSSFRCSDTDAGGYKLSAIDEETLEHLEKQIADLLDRWNKALKRASEIQRGAGSSDTQQRAFDLAMSRSKEIFSRMHEIEKEVDRLRFRDVLS